MSLGFPLTAINLRKAFSMPIADMSVVNSICTALVTKHVVKRHQSFTVSWFTFTLYGPKTSTPQNSKGAALLTLVLGRGGISGKGYGGPFQILQSGHDFIVLRTAIFPFIM